MNEVLFVERREQDWKRANQLCAKADVSPVNLKSEELSELIRLYKRLSKDLATARTHTTNVELIEFLNGLCGRAYAIVYRPKVKGIGSALADALKLTARTFRKRGWFVLVSGSMLVGFAVFAYSCLLLRPDTRTVLVPAAMEATFQHWKSGTMEARDAAASLSATLTYGSNNPLVSIVAGALSLATFGVGTVLSLFSNGTLLGALVFEVAPVGRVGYLFTHILPHGVTELGGIVVSGSGGLCLGWALIHPGRRRRADALREAGKDAIVLFGLSIVMMFIAAPIEGFFSFNPLVPGFLKLGFAAMSLFAWAFFFGGYGREPSAAGAPASSRGRLSRDMR